MYHRITNNGLHDLQSRAYESTTAAKRPTTLSIRSLVRVHLHRLPLTIGGKVVDINPPSLSHELPCQRSRCNWLTCDRPHHPSKEGTRKLCCRTVIYMHIDIRVHSKITRTQREGKRHYFKYRDQLVTGMSTSVATRAIRLRLSACAVTRPLSAIVWANPPITGLVTTGASMQLLLWIADAGICCWFCCRCYCGCVHPLWLLLLLVLLRLPPLPLLQPEPSMKANDTTSNTDTGRQAAHRVRESLKAEQAAA